MKAHCLVLTAIDVDPADELLVRDWFRSASNEVNPQELEIVTLPSYRMDAKETDLVVLCRVVLDPDTQPNALLGRLRDTDPSNVQLAGRLTQVTVS